MRDDGHSRDHVGSLSRGLEVLELLAANPGGLTLTEMADKADLTRAGARRLLLTLVATDYAIQTSRKFTLSPRLLSVARIWVQGASLWTYAEPFMRAVAAQFNESCSAAVLAGEDVVYVARIPGRHLLSVALYIGTRLPAWCTSMGRVLLSDLPPPTLLDFLDTADIARKTDKSITDRILLMRKITEAARDDFAIVDEELEPGLRSIAVPIRDRSRRIVAAINLSTQASRYTVEQMEREMLPPLKDAARQIEDFFVVQ